MKTLEQLGISPAPWRINDHASVLDRYCEIISGQYGPYNWHNAHLIAAAPKLYDAGQKTEAVLTRLFKLDEFAALLKSGAADALIACRDELRNALAYAAGEKRGEG